MNIKKLQSICYEMRKTILETSFNCQESAHIGGALSMVEILAVLYHRIMKLNLSNPKDRFILSKGHGFLGLLSVLKSKKIIDKKILNDFQVDNSEIIAHPIMNPKIGIETSNGSLGQGLSYGVGLAIAYKLKKKRNSIYVMIGDGECYEGSIWEAAITATDQRLDNLTALLDVNGFQNDGETSANMDFNSLDKKWKGFGWNTILSDGHNLNTIINSFKKIKRNKPNIIIFKTTKGKGVDFMENNNDWHHGRLTKNLLETSLENLKKRYVY